MRILLLLCVLLVPTSASAQERGLLNVTVVDQLGGVLTKAKVTLKGQQSRTLNSDANSPGVYRAAGLPFGSYTLVVEAPGFTAVTRRVEIGANQPQDVSVVLAVPAVTQKVEVQGRLPIDSRRSLNGLTLSGKDLEMLSNQPAEMLFQLWELAGSRGRPGDVTIYVDGYSDFRHLPPKSAIDVILINAEPYSAEFSEPGTRRVEIITKPGAQKPQGTSQFNFNNDKLNARDPLATSKPPLDRYTGTGYFSTPIIPQKWEFNVYAGRWQDDENAVINATYLNGTLDPTQFRETLAAPSLLTNVTLDTEYSLSERVRLKAEYSHEESHASNQGLTSGLDLPERALDTASRTDTARVGLLSVIGTNLVHEIRVQFRDNAMEQHAITNRAAILVLDAYNEGGNQLLVNDNRNRGVQLNTRLTKSIGSEVLRVGFQGTYARLTSVNMGDFSGTYVFGADVDRDPNGLPILDAQGAVTSITSLERLRRTLLGSPGYTPSQFTMSRGEPTVETMQWQGAAYVESDWQRSEHLSLSAGLRYERQNDVRRAMTLVPRVAFSWAVGKNGGVVRGGSGLFLDRIPASLTQDSIRFDGQHQEQFVISNPTFFPNVLPPTVNAPPNIQTTIGKADDLRVPRHWMSNLSYERPLLGPLFASIGYTREQGTALTRMIDLNTPVAGIKPFPLRGQILEFQSTGRSTRDELQVGLRADIGHESKIFVNYLLASTKSDTDGPYTLPADANNLAGEFAPASSDARHHVSISGTVTIPKVSIIVAPFLQYASPTPFNITTGLDNNGDGHFTDRPAFAQPGDAGAVTTPFGVFNPTPRPGEGIIPRNYGRSPSVLSVNLALAKVVVLGDRKLGTRFLTFSVSAANLLNTARLHGLNGVLLSPTFGQATTANPGRRITLGISVGF